MRFKVVERSLESNCRIYFQECLAQLIWLLDPTDVHDLQPTSYQFASRELGISNPGLAFQVLLKTRSPQVEFTTVTRTKDQEQEMLSTYTQVLKAVAQGIFWKNRGWMCGDCQFKYRCGE